MAFLIIGGSGFIGSHLTNELKKREPESIIYNLDIVENNHDGETKYVQCDVRNPITVPFDVSPNDVIFNFAAIHRTPGHPDLAYFDTNIRGAENVCEFARRHKVRQMVFTSSIAPYGASEELKSEQTLPTPNTPYGISKLVAEKIHQIWQSESPDRELTIVRPGVVFGYGENGNFTRLYWSLRKRKFMYPGRKDTIKACVYVKDLVGFMLYMLENHKHGTSVYNCTFEPAYTIEQIVEHMKASAGIKQRTLLVPAWLLMPAAYLAKIVGSPMGICPERVRKLMISTNICGKQMAESGYKFAYTFDSAIEDWLNDSGGEGLK